MRNSRSSRRVRRSVAEQAEDRRQHGREVDQGEEAAHVAQTARYGMTVRRAVEVDRGPHAQQIFDREHQGRQMLEPPQRHGVARMDRGDRFDDHAGHVGDDQSGEADIEHLRRAARRQRVIEQRGEAAAERDEASQRHGSARDNGTCATTLKTRCESCATGWR
jgi:hypothetical protein